MACSNRNRYRPRTVAFRLTDDEFTRLEQKVKITGEVKGDYLREMALNGEISISVGKFKSDKLALALKRLSEELNRLNGKESGKDVMDIINESSIMIQELYELVLSDEDELIVM